MLHRDYDISLLVPLLNILKGFRDLLQGITSVDDRLELPSRGKLCDEIHSLQVVYGHTALYFLTSGDGGPKDPNHVSQTHDAGKKDTFGLQRVLAAVKSGRADDIKYQVVGSMCKRCSVIDLLQAINFLWVGKEQK
jgi:hypothetical protein